MCGGAAAGGVLELELLCCRCYSSSGGAALVQPQVLQLHRQTVVHMQCGMPMTLSEEACTEQAEYLDFTLT